MGLLTPNDIQDFKSLYTLQIRYLLSAESQIVDGLQSMIDNATDEQLKGAFQSHLQESRVQVDRLKELVNDVKGEVDDKKDAIATALIASAVNIVKESDAGPLRDAALLATAQKVEHYEIASYGAAHAWATQLGLDKHVTALQKTLDEEKHANHLLGTIAERLNNVAVAV